MTASDKPCGAVSRGVPHAQFSPCGVAAPALGGGPGQEVLGPQDLGRKVLTIKPTARLYIWCGFVLFCFCFAAASPPLDFVECCLISSWNAPFFSTYLASFISSFLVALLPLRRVSFLWVIWGTVWVGHLFPPPPQVAVMTHSW